MQGSAQSSVTLSLKPLLIQADGRVVIFRLAPDRQVDIWQLISVNINRQRSLDAPTITEKLLGLAHSHTHSPAILSIQATKSWDVPESGSAWICVLW